MPANAGMASDEFQTARPHTRPSAATATGWSRFDARAAASGIPVTSGMRKLGGGPVAVISAMYGVPQAARSAAATPAARPPSARPRPNERSASSAAQRSW